MEQEFLFGYKGRVAGDLHTQVISQRKSFENLFEGFTGLRAISYVASPLLLNEFYEKFGYKSLEIVVGENLTDIYREELTRRGVEVTEQLTERVKSGTLRIFIPKRTIHTKLYILEKTGLYRVILSSANLTKTAEKAQQVNYAWYFDLEPQESLLQKVIEDYEKHRKECSLFMDDLLQLIEKSSDRPRREIIEIWLKTSVAEETDSAVIKVLQEISKQSLENPKFREEPLITIRLPEAPVSRKQIERILSPLSPTFTSSEVLLNGQTYIRYIHENHRIPLMQVNLQSKELRLGIRDSILTISEPLPDSSSVFKALGKIEAYLNTVDLGKAYDPRFAKASMFEALLYIFFTPFVNEHMKFKRKLYGSVEARGPLFLYIYGPSLNGKTTFLRFALKLISGYDIKPFTREDFNKRNIKGVMSIGTIFPLIFDDVDIWRSSTSDEILKSYWEAWWSDEYIFPQIGFSSNKYTLKEWAKSRIKRIDFNVHFVPSAQNKERLARILEYNNPIYRWFSHLYIENLLRLESFSETAEDDLHVARLTMKSLYKHANRDLPDYFPHEPIEHLYDPGRMKWNELLNWLHKARLKQERGRLRIDFDPDMEYQIQEYVGYLPQIIKHERRGNTLVIETPDEFNNWLKEMTSPQPNWLARISKIFRK